MTQRNESLVSSLRRSLASSDAMRRVLEALPGTRVELTGLTLEAKALVLAAIRQSTKKRLAVLVPGDAGLDELAASLRLFLDQPDEVSVFPNPSLSPYQDVPASLAVTRDDLRALSRLASGTAAVLLVPVRNLFRPLPRPDEFASRLRRIRTDDGLDPHAFADRLLEDGYARVDLVGEPGELAFRGGIIDLFPPDLDAPIRIELFGDAVESIRTFDTDTQRSERDCESIVVGPAALFPSSDEARRRLAHRLSIDFNDTHFKHDLAQKIDRLHETGTFPGIENYLPLVLPSAPLPEHLGPEWVWVSFEPEEIRSTIERYGSLLDNEYKSAAERGRAVYPPETILAPPEMVRSVVAESPLAFSAVHVEGRGREEMRFRSSSAKRYINRLGELAPDLSSSRAQHRPVVIFAGTRGGREKIERLLNEFDVALQWDPAEPGEAVSLASGDLPHGFVFEDIGVSILSEWDLFEHPADARGGRHKRRAELFQTDLRDLRLGDFVVHVDHGIGRFMGLRRLEFGDTEREVMEIEYQGGGKLLLPVDSLDLVQKYSGGDDAQPRLDRLGGTSWARIKASVKRAIRDMADELLKLYATRRMVDGHQFSKDSPWQFDFEEAFEYEETEDQAASIDDVKSDMESRQPMDRLLCGDVGYGKTEVAMRSAFKAVLDGKQVAVLAPTTILAFQHYRTFRRRVSSFPVQIELLSRHWGAKDQKEILRRVEAGEIDVLIGTHRILSKDVAFKDLGLLIIDEEQRFGVAQKERLKHLKKSVDVLAMSATPIPRTLHMSMVGIRDISVIETPPKDRLAIQTAVVPFQDDFIREAIEFETEREGQIFFVHNRVDSIYAMKEYLENLIPGLRVVVGHGQMDERQLEKAMIAFIDRKFDVLLATTIIENGIDIPACNTILINHAERFGLSQLYQLRGRVGRSDRLAFCYLIVPSEQTLSSEARKRLAAIQEFSDLGAGFRIAARDLEIRGSGNILGGEQSGHIAAVGFEMYTRLLEETVRELKGETITEFPEPSVKLGLDIFIPHDYIADDNLRMMFYKRIASARTDERLEEVRGELRDRFGAIPRTVEAFFDFVRLKHRAQSMGVVAITRSGTKAAVRFRQDARVDPNRLFALLARAPEASFSPEGVLSLPLEARGTDMIREILETLHVTGSAA